MVFLLRSDMTEAAAHFDPKGSEFPDDCSGAACTTAAANGFP